MSSIISSGQNRRGYAIDPQLKILSNFNPPVSKAIAPVGLMLIYPVVDDSQTTPSMRRFDDTPAWNAVNNAKMWEWYLAGQEFGRSRKWYIIP